MSPPISSRCAGVSVLKKKTRSSSWEATYCFTAPSLGSSCGADGRRWTQSGRVLEECGARALPSAARSRLTTAYRRRP